MTSYSISLHRKNGTIRLNDIVELPAMEAVWRQLHAISASVGQAGEYLEVADENGGIVIRIGVMTEKVIARSWLRAA